MNKKRLLILISGSGSNLQAFIDQCQTGQLNAEIVAVISNKAGVFGLERAEKAGIKQHVLDHKAFASREDFDQALAELVHSYHADAIILAGFMRILSAGFTEQFLGKLFNIHPSLLPKYPGLHTHQRAIDAGDSEAGVSVHFVTAELDGGPIVLQAKVNIDKTDTEQSLAKKVLEKEHIIYPQVIDWFLQGRLVLHDDGAYLDNQKLPSTGQML